MEWNKAVDKLIEICKEATIQLRKGDIVEKRTSGNIEVTEIYMMPHVSKASNSLEKIDMEFITIGVNREIAEKNRQAFIEICESYPRPDRLAAGPSYIEVGAEVGDQGLAFQMFAIGEVLGLWKVITPARLGIIGAESRQLAGSGFIMISGYKK